MEPKAPTRRDVLRQAGLVPVVFGLAALGCRQQPAPAPPPAPPPVGGGPVGPPAGKMPDWLYTRFSWMLEADLPGVIFRVPKAADDRQNLGTGLVDRAARGSIDARELFVEAIVGVLDDAAYAKYVEGARPEENVTLVAARRDPDKTLHVARVDGMAFPPGDALDSARFVAAMRRLVHGEHDERLKARAEKERAKADPAALAAFDRLATKEDVQAAGYLASATRYGAIAAVVLARQEEAPGPRKDALARLVMEEEQRSSSVVMPFGLEMKSEGGGCAGAGPNVACGMAMPAPSSYRFLGYLTSNA